MARVRPLVASSSKGGGPIHVSKLSMTKYSKAMDMHMRTPEAWMKSL